MDKLFLQSSCFLRSSFFKTVTSSQQLFFQNSYFFRAKLLPRSHFLRIESFFGLLLFVAATILAGVLFRIKISTERLLFRSRHFFTASTFSGELHFGKSNFSEKPSALPTFFWRTSFWQRLIFQKTLPS